MLLVILLVLYSVAFSNANPSIVISGSAVYSANATRTNETWPFPKVTVSSRSTNFHHVSPTPLRRSSSWDRNSSTLSHTRSPISTASITVQTIGGSSSIGPPPGFGFPSNRTLQLNGTWTVNNSTANKSHVLVATALPPFKNSTSKTNKSSNQTQTSSCTPKYLPTGALLAPYLNTSSSNSTWAFSSKNVSAPIASEVTSFRVAAAAAPNGYPRAVFAHFMVGNVKHWTISNWIADIQLARIAHIDGFALNIANGEFNNNESIDLAFQAAASAGFKIIFSFDYAGKGAWSQDEVIRLVNKYKDSGAYFLRGTQPLVSTFEGPDNATDWKNIKAQTGCFFMPDWSSKGARDALNLADGVADGLFSWAAWPWGNTDSNTYVDASYEDFLERAGNKPYMMPVSPWFYTNMPGFDKNWLWRGDDLWRDRWEQVLWVKPDYVQIISWNDYGESHHIGPLRPGTYEAFEPDFGNSPFNYALDMPHDGWRALLPFYIDTYKNNITTITQEMGSLWYRTFPAASVACSDGLTTANTASQLLLEFSPRVVAQDKIFYSIVFSGKLGNPVVTVTIGGVDLGATWTDIPFDGIGVWHGSVAYGSRVGAVRITIHQNGVQVMQLTGKDIAIECNNGLINWNAWTGTITGRTISATPSLSIDKQVCTEGTAPGNFKGLCEFTCRHGYCPLGACQCLKVGELIPPPVAATPIVGYPAEGLGSSYAGLCNFVCNAGYCPPSACSPVQHALVEPTVSPFLPAYCNGGKSHPDKPGYQGLCDYSCGVGFCPMHVCECTSTGTLVIPAPTILKYDGKTTDGSLDHGLCKFTCERGYCPQPCHNNEGAWYSCDEEKEECPEESPCNYSKNFANLDEVARDSDEHFCKFGHTLKALIAMFDTALTDYNSIDNGYDSAFGHYADSVKETIQPALDRSVHPFPYGRGNPHFTCTWANESPQDCPVDTYERYSDSWDLYFELKDRAGYFSELNTTYGVLEDWVQFGKYEEFIDRSCPSSPCFPSLRFQYIHGYPLSVDDPKVPNPKEILLQSIPNMNSLRQSLVDTRRALVEGSWNGPIDDVVEVLSMPVFMLIQAVDSMRTVKDIGEKAAAEEKKNLIITIISAILFFLPFAGQIAIAGNLVNLGRMIIMVAIAGEAALTIQDIVANPALAPLLILDVLSKGKLKTPGDFGVQATNRRALSPSDLTKLGPVYKRYEDSLRSAVGTCSI